MPSAMIHTLYDALREDPWRKANPFSQDIVDANSLMHHSYVYEDEIAEVLREWCLKWQPCQFGRVAAKYGLIHFCILTERDVRDGDEAIKEKGSMVIVPSSAVETMGLGGMLGMTSLVAPGSALARPAA